MLVNLQEKYNYSIDEKLEMTLITQTEDIKCCGVIWTICVMFFTPFINYKYFTGWSNSSR